MSAKPTHWEVMNPRVKGQVEAVCSFGRDASGWRFVTKRAEVTCKKCRERLSHPWRRFES